MTVDLQAARLARLQEPRAARMVRYSGEATEHACLEWHWVHRQASGSIPSRCSPLLTDSPAYPGQAASAAALLQSHLLKLGRVVCFVFFSDHVVG